MAKRITPNVLVAGLLLLAGLALPASAPAKLPPISGKLSKPGYTVIALAENGAARTDRAPKGKFKLRSPAKTVTLHLRAPDGTYAGPIVVGQEKKGKRALVGVMAGAKLGKVKLKGGKGYAKLKKRLAKKWLDAKRTATAKKGAPIGAGNFGRVRVKKLKGTSADRDLDGIPASFDIDDDGDLILDNLDRKFGAGASSAEPGLFELWSELGAVGIASTVNANATAVTDQQIDAVLARYGNLVIGIVPGDSAELDCGGAHQQPARAEGLSYCTQGGTGSLFEPGVGGDLPGSGPEFPECCDGDGDGLGTLSKPPGFGPGPGAVILRHGATSTQIGTGDVLIERVTNNGVETEYPGTLQYVFSTVPALASYSDGQRHSATISYPNNGAGLPVSAGSSGDVVVTMMFWRPQRKALPGEAGYGVPGAWTDIGGLVYTPTILSKSEFNCPESTISESDPNLTSRGSTVLDLARDRPADPANTLTFTWNVTQCLAAAGGPFFESSLGESIPFTLDAATLHMEGVARQQFSLQRVP